MLDKHLIAKTEPAALQENMVVRKDVRITVLEIGRASCRERVCQYV